MITVDLLKVQQAIADADAALLGMTPANCHQRRSVAMEHHRKAILLVQAELSARAVEGGEK